MAVIHREGKSIPLPDGWLMAHLGDVAKVETGGTPSRANPEYWGGSIPWMSSGEINQRRLSATAEHITEEGLRNSNAKVYPAGTVMVAMNGQGATRGKASLLGIDASCNQSLAALHSLEKSLNRFIFHFLDVSYNYLRSITGDGRKGLNLELIRSILIPLPPLEEQRGIAAVLDSIDEAIEREEAVVAATECLRDAMLHKLLTRGIPGRHSEWRDVPGLGIIPASWEVARLGEVAEVNKGNWDPIEGNDILYLDLTSVAAPGVLSAPTPLAANDAPSRARRRVASGDILISTVRPNLRGFARVPAAPENLIASTGFAVLTPNSDASGSFLYHHVMNLRFAMHMEAATTGQAYPAVRPSDVADYRIPLPPLPEQDVIAEAVDAVENAINSGRIETHNLKSLKASAAEALLTGKTRVVGMPQGRGDAR